MASYQFKDYKQLEKYMRLKMQEVLEMCATVTLNELKAMVSENIYSWKPREYERTNMLIESISKTEVKNAGNTYQCKIYFDVNKIQSVIRMPDSWNAHADFNGNFAGDDLIGWLEYGTPTNPYYQHPEYRFIRDTYEWLCDEYMTIFKKNAKKLGVPIE